MLPFLQSQTNYKLNGYVSKVNYWSKWVSHSNIDDINLLFFSLVKKGYGSLQEVKEFDTMDIMQILEYEAILSDIEQLEYDESKNN